MKESLHIGLAILAVSAVAVADAPLNLFQSGATNRLAVSTWIYVERMEATNMYGVILYDRQADGSMRIADAQHAHFDVKDDIELAIHLRHVRIVTEVDGDIREIRAMHYPVIFDLVGVRVIQRDYGPTSGSPFAQEKREQSEESFRYRVHSGDTLSSISEIFGVPIGDILEWNPELEKQGDLPTGHLIWIPPYEAQDFEPAP